MSNYLTSTQFLARFGTELAEDFLALTEPDLSTEVTRLITRAEALMDGYIDEHYDVPITAADSQELLKDWCYALVAYAVHEHTDGPEVQEVVRQAYMDAIYQLKDVQAGKLILPGGTSQLAEVSFEATSNSVHFDWDGDAEGTF